MNLIRFLSEEWLLPVYRNMLHGKVLFITCEETCYRITENECEDIGELRSTHEEADTRLILHAKHAANVGSMSVIITADDTDIMILCLGFQKYIPCPIYQKCG